MAVNLFAPRTYVTFHFNWLETVGDAYWMRKFPVSDVLVVDVVVNHESIQPPHKHRNGRSDVTVKTLASVACVEWIIASTMQPPERRAGGNATVYDFPRDPAAAALLQYSNQKFIDVSVHI